MAFAHETSIDLVIARAMALARQSASSSAIYLRTLRTELKWPSLTRQTLHCWENGRTRVPAAALIVAAQLAGMGVDDILTRASRHLEVEALAR